MALQCLSKEFMLDVSGHVCEPCCRNGSMEHRTAACHLLCVQISDSAKTHGKLQQPFVNDAMSRAQAFRWYKMFSEGRTLTEDEQRSG